MKRDPDRLSENYDLLVIGGGIVGAWTAWDAALRGLRVALVEQHDWASGTSSASSKLIHGGLRYLERLEFGLVRGSLHERRRLARLGPHRVWPLRFGIPIYRGGRVGRWRFKLGLWLYDLLAGRGQPVAGHESFNAKSFAEAFPYSATEHLRAGFSYGDCQTDDARFVLELVDGLLAAGGCAVNYAQVEELITDPNSGQATGARITDLESGTGRTLHARHVINTTGVWSQALTGRTTYRMTKGIHLVLPRLPEQQALLLLANDGRVFFVLPWYERTLIGTTDTDYTGDPGAVEVAPEDVRYLLDSVRPMLRNVRWSADDVIGSFAGLRMLQADPNAPPSAVSRGWTWQRETNGVICSIGGKFTTAREDAARLVDQICDQPCRTNEQPLPWAPNEAWSGWLQQQFAAAAKLGLSEATTQQLARRYGRHLPDLLQRIETQPDLAEPIDPELLFCRAEIGWCREREMVVRDDDLWRRRIPLQILARSIRQA